MSDLRVRVWSPWMRRKNAASAPKLQSNPPTTKSFSQNVKRTFFQTSIWLSADSSDPPTLDGCSRDEPKKTLLPSAITTRKTSSTRWNSQNDVLKHVQHRDAVVSMLIFPAQYYVSVNLQSVTVICQYSTLKTWKGQWLILMSKLVHICATVSISILSFMFHQINNWWNYCSMFMLMTVNIWLP